jgi:hypothetical protein
MAWVTDFLEIEWRAPIALLGSLVLLSYGAVDLSQAISSAKWPKAPGRILSCQIVGRRFYHPSITYVYTVENTTHTGNTYRLGDPFYWKRQTAETAAQTYAPGSTVFVSFDPSRPEKSALEAGFTPDTFRRIEWSLPVFLITLWMVRMDLKRVRARRLIQSQRPVKFRV